MAAPRMQPHGTIDMTSHHKMDGRLTCFGFGEDDRAVNPGDLLIVGTNWLKENSKLIETEFCLRVRGRDMAYFVQHALVAASLWKDNQHWLNAPASSPGLDTRPMTAIRSASQQDAIRGFYQRNITA